MSEYKRLDPLYMPGGKEVTDDVTLRCCPCCGESIPSMHVGCNTMRPLGEHFKASAHCDCCGLEFCSYEATEEEAIAAAEKGWNSRPGNKEWHECGYDSFVTLGEQDPTPQWISVKERNPETNKEFIVRVVWHDGEEEKEWVGSAWYYPDDWGWGVSDSCHVTHWMPLPDPPKDGE